jgi:outer membrane protein OmpA-like peptidoglycan-associated protein
VFERAAADGFDGKIAMRGGAITMRSVAGRLLAVVLAMAGSACTTVLAPERTPAIGPPFNEALKERYLELASSKWDQGSWETLHFRDKARSAMLGDVVYPDPVTWVPRGLEPELTGQRQRLLLFVDAGAWKVAPEEAAEAQVAFDCWLSDVKATLRLESECRETFTAALDRTEQTLLAELPETYVVLFESGSDTVDGAGLNVATAVARAAPLVEPARIDVVGYADPSGSASANQALSRQRAENVAAALARAGVSTELLNVETGSAPGAGVEGRRVEVDLRG